MAQLTIDMTGRRGLATQHWGDYDRDTGYQQPNLRYLAEDGQMVDGFYNPLRRSGYLSAANSYLANISHPTAFTAITNCVIYDDVNNDVIFGSDGRYFQSLNDGLDDLQFYLGSSLGDYGTTGTPSIKDLEIYQINGVRRLFTVYEKSGNIELGHYPLAYDTGSGTDTFFSGMGGGSITFNRLAFMRVADNGFAYLFNDNAVHKIDGTTAAGVNGLVTPNVLVFPATFTITDAIDYRAAFFIAISQAPIIPSVTASSKSTFNLPCGVYVWDRRTTTVGSVDYIPLFGVRVIHRLYVTGDGSLRAIVTNAEGVTEIREYTGSTFVCIEEVGRNTFPSWHDSVASFRNFIIWLGADGTIYLHGKTNMREKDGLYKVGKLSEATIGTGAVFFGGGNDFSYTSGYKDFRSGLILSYRDSVGDVKVKQWDIYGSGAASSSSSSNLCLQGDVFTPVTYLPEISTVRSVMVYMAPGTNSGTTAVGTIKIYLNQSSTAWASKTITRDDCVRGYAHIDINKPYVNALQLEVEWPTNISIGNNNEMAPSIAIVEYEPSGGNG